MRDASRRQVLGAAATGTALSVAGCSALDDSGDDAIEGNESVPQTDDSEGIAAVAVDIDQRIAEEQAEIQEQLENEEITQEEAQAALQAAEVDALEDAVAAVESYATDTDGFDVVDTIAQAGALLVDGDPAAAIDALNTDDVGALIPAAQFHQLQAQRPPEDGE